jgi:hypothetical protein
VGPRRVPKVPEWLGYLRREIEAPDLWGVLQDERELLAGATSSTANTPFTAAEKGEIVAQLNEVKALIRAQYQLNKGELEAIESRLDYLADAANRLGRVDWREALAGALLGLVVQMVVPVEPVRAALTVLGRALGHMFEAGPLELP